LITSEIEKKILLLLKNSELYGYQINKLLQNQNININISRIYTILNNMETDMLLYARWEKSSTGPRRKIYSLR
jgi:DNA-binding PadR family transcriptional regulator